MVRFGGAVKVAQVRTGGFWPMDGCFWADQMRTSSLPEARLQRGMLVSSRAGSQRLSPG